MTENSENIELCSTPKCDTFIVGTVIPEYNDENDDNNEIIGELLDNCDEKDDGIRPELTEEQKEFEREACSMLSSADPATGLEYAWLEIRKRLCDGDHPVNVLPLLFDYYVEKCDKFDPWICYMLACSHFEKEELGPKNRFERKQLEARVKKLMKIKKQNPGQNMNQFLYNNSDK